MRINKLLNNKLLTQDPGQGWVHAFCGAPKSVAGSPVKQGMSPAQIRLQIRNSIASGSASSSSTSKPIPVLLSFELNKGAEESQLTVEGDGGDVEFNEGDEDKSNAPAPKKKARK